MRQLSSLVVAECVNNDGHLLTGGHVPHATLRSSAKYWRRGASSLVGQAVS